MRKRYVAPMLACLSLAVPAGASAHAKSPTVALDYRLVLDDGARTLDRVRVGILDGDRSLRIASNGTPVVVFGDLQEAMLRIDRSGAWANRASATAVAQRLVTAGHGWQRIGGPTFAWHDHRLASPPYDGGQVGPVARFRIPVRVGNRATAIAGSFVRYRRPAVWPWLVAATVGVVAAVALRRSVPTRGSALAVGLAVVAGLAAVASLAAFGAADSPTGRVAWVELILAVVVGVAAGVGLVRLQGERRVLLAALIGAAAAATSIDSFGVFRHAVVISAVPPSLARLLCATAFIAGAGAAAVGLHKDRAHW